MLTIFASPKPFEGHIGVIQRNAIRSWVALDDRVEVILIGDESGIERAATELKARHISQVARNELGTPQLDSIFTAANREARNPVLCYANADIVFLDDLIPAVETVRRQLSRYLMVGQRWDLEVKTELAIQNGWVTEMRDRISSEARRHPPAGSDYFIFPRGEFRDLPPFALGRSGWDNWMIYAARRRGMAVVDASRSITAVHQDHDYAHLPGGQAHYRLPESAENLALAGGRETVFTLRDATWRLEGTQLTRHALGQADGLRNLEASLIAKLGAGRPARGVRKIVRWLRPRDDEGRT